jgi:hypothetical protein
VQLDAVAVDVDPLVGARTILSYANASAVKAAPIGAAARAPTSASGWRRPRRSGWPPPSWRRP